VLLHGGACTAADWDAVAAFLVPKHRVVAFDFRSHGRSTDTGDEWSMDDAVADTEAVIASLGLGNPLVAGHSLGGAVASVYGAAHPEAPGVVIVDGSGHALPSEWPGADPDEARAAFRKALAAQTAGEPPPEEALDADALAKRIANARTFATTANFDPDVVAAGVERAMVLGGDGLFRNNPSPRATLAMLRAVGSVETFDVMRAARCRVLYVRAIGEQLARADDEQERGHLMEPFRLGVARELESIAAEHPNFSHSTIESGHMIPLERPAELAETLLAFFAAR